MPGASVPSASGDPDAASASEPDLAAALHELSNDLTVILGWLEHAHGLAKGSELDQPVRVALDRARRAHRIARRAVGVDPTRSTAESLRAIVDECVMGVAREALQRGVVVSSEIDARAERLAVSAGERLLQILTNLLLNALEATPTAGRVRIQCSIGSELDTVRLIVTDDGPGVPPVQRQRLFTRGRSGRAAGAGIGLSHSREIASNEGGYLSLLPYEAGKGAAFELRWPSAAIASRQGLRRDRILSLSGLEIAVVDDDSSVLELLALALSARGASVSTFSQRGEFDVALIGTCFDVALLDASPYGHTLGEALTKLGRVHPELDVVLISGAMDPDPIVSRLGLTWIRKPFDMEEVIENICAVRAKR